MGNGRLTAQNLRVHLLCGQTLAQQCETTQSGDFQASLRSVFEKYLFHYSRPN